MKMLIKYFVIFNVLANGIGFVSANSKTKISRQIKKSQSTKSEYKKSNYGLKISYAASNLESVSAPYHVGFLDNEGISLSPIVNYRLSPLISLFAGPSITLSKEAQSDGFYQSDVSSLKYYEYKLVTGASVNLTTGMTIFSPYIKFALGFSSFDLNFSSEDQGFSQLNDSITNIKGKGLVSEVGVGAKLIFYKGVGLFVEMTYKSFNASSIKYEVNSELAQYEKNLLASEKKSKFTGFSTMYGLALDF